MTTVSFEALRTRNERALERAGYQPEARSQDLQQETSQQRARIVRLIEKRAGIEDIASTENQREAYGLEQWQQNFVRLRDVRNAPGTDLEGEALRQHIWKKVPNSRFRRFQELFSYPHQWIVPLFDMGAKNTVTFRGAPDFDTLSLRGCLVSPDRISDELASDLHLCEFSAEDERHPEQRLRKKRAAVPRLKKLWESAVPLQPGHHRILVVAPPGPDVELAYPKVRGPHPEALGSILYVRRTEQGGSHPGARTVQHFTSAYEAARKTMHQRENCGRELPGLAVMEERIRALNARLDTEWRDPRKRPELTTFCGQLCTDVAGELRRCANRHKIEAHDLVMEAASLHDKSGKVNPTRSMTKLTAVINRFYRRYGEAKGKAGYNQQDFLTLRQHITQQEHILYVFRTYLAAAAPAIDQPNVALFGDREMPPAEAEREAAGLLVHMHLDPAPLQRLTLQPFRFYGTRLADGCEDVRAALLARDRGKAKDTMLRLHLLGKFQAVRTWFAKLQTGIFDVDHICVARIRTFVAALQKLFSTFQIYPDHIVEEYRTPFEDLERGLQGLQALLVPYEGRGRDMDVEERTDLFRALKEYLDGFDIEERARALT